MNFKKYFLKKVCIKNFLMYDFHFSLELFEISCKPRDNVQKGDDSC